MGYKCRSSVLFWPGGAEDVGWRLCQGEGWMGSLSSLRLSLTSLPPCIHDRVGLPVHSPAPTKPHPRLLFLQLSCFRVIPLAVPPLMSFFPVRHSRRYPYHRNSRTASSFSFPAPRLPETRVLSSCAVQPQTRLGRWPDRNLVESPRRLIAKSAETSRSSPQRF